MKRVVLISVLFLTAALPLGARERDPMSLKISPVVSFAPANLVVRATIQNDAKNRVVEVVAESEDFYRSSEMQLDGDRAPRTTMFEFRNLPQGVYEVRAVLYAEDGEARAEVRQQVNVIAIGAGN